MKQAFLDWIPFFPKEIMESIGPLKRRQKNVLSSEEPLLMEHNFWLRHLAIGLLRLYVMTLSNYTKRRTGIRPAVESSGFQVISLGLKVDSSS